MLSYLISIENGDGVAAFYGTFSDEDVRRLRRARQGRSFDLDNFKAYLDGDGHICLARKPDYLLCSKLRYSELWRHLAEARVVQWF